MRPILGKGLGLFREGNSLIFSRCSLCSSLGDLPVLGMDRPGPGVSQTFPPQKTKGIQLLPHSQDVFFRLVELLFQVLGRGLAGDLDHGELLVVPGEVTGGPADAVTAVLLRQETCGGQPWSSRSGDTGQGGIPRSRDMEQDGIPWIRDMERGHGAGWDPTERGHGSGRDPMDQGPGIELRDQEYRAEWDSMDQGHRAEAVPPREGPGWDPMEQRHGAG